MTTTTEYKVVHRAVLWVELTHRLHNSDQGIQLVCPGDTGKTSIYLMVFNSQNRETNCLCKLVNILLIKTSYKPILSFQKCCSLCMRSS